MNTDVQCAQRKSPTKGITPTVISNNLMFGSKSLDCAITMRYIAKQMKIVCIPILQLYLFTPPHHIDYVHIARV